MGSLKWERIVQIGTPEGKVYTEFLLRSDGRWMMWEVSDHTCYLREMEGDIDGRNLDPEQQWNDGDFDEFIEKERLRQGFVYIPTKDTYARNWKELILAEPVCPLCV
jgi:hypothetical protein